jgi:hypothetical protein
MSLAKSLAERLLRTRLLPLITCSERPCYRQSGNNFDKLAPLHWAWPSEPQHRWTNEGLKMRFRNKYRQLGQFRRIYYLAFVRLASIRLWLRLNESAP